MALFSAGVVFVNSAVAQWEPAPIFINEDTTWNSETPNLIFDTKILIGNNATLTIEKGTRIVFRGNEEYPFYAPGIHIESGKIVTHGTKEEPVVFTSSGDGFALNFSDTNQTSIFHFVVLENGGFIPSFSDEGGDMVPHIPVITVDGGKFRMENSKFVNSRTLDVEARDRTIYDADGNPTVNEDGSFLENKLQVDIVNSNFSFLSALHSHLDCWAFESEEDEEGHIDEECVKRITLKDNWYGNANGPTTDKDREEGIVKGYAIFGLHHLDLWRTNDEIPDTVAPPKECVGDCFSNIIFLPGFEASRLYRGGVLGTENQLWEPNRDGDAEKLFLGEDGKSAYSDIYTRDVIDEVNLSPVGQSNIYKSFLNDLENWKNEEGLIVDYAVIPYDWRLSISDILEGGTLSEGDRVSYIEESIDPYIKKKLRDLASTSKSGKVTIITHSNGGLVAKALVNALGPAETEKLIDTIVFVATPQSGTPQAIGGVLQGFDQGIPKDWMPIFLSPKFARTLAHNMPSAYSLLPSKDYFTGQGSETNTPVISFREGALTQGWIGKYGDEIDTAEEMEDFLKESEGKVSSDSDELGSPSSINEELWEYAENTHQTLDEDWTVPDSVSLYQIAGYGEETLGSIEYWTGDVCVRTFRGWCLEYQEKIQYTPKVVIDGDGTVVAPSALAMKNARRYWVDLFDYNDSNIDRQHSNILEIPQLREFIRENILTRSKKDLPNYISDTEPSYIGSGKRLQYVLHSPLHLSVQDRSGNKVGALSSDIPGARYKRFGEVQYISIPSDIPHSVFLDGFSDGSFTLEMREVGGDDVLASTIFSGIPSVSDTEVSMDVFGGTIESASPLRIDYDGDKSPDFVLKPKVNETVLLPPPDETPPEVKISFDPRKKEVVVDGIDQGPTSVAYSVVRETGGNHKQKSRIKTATLTDRSGNTTILTYGEKFPNRDKGTVVELISIKYKDDVERFFHGTELKYKWSMDYKMFASFLKTKNASVESHYRPKKGITLLMEKPRDLDWDGDDDSDRRPIKQKLSGMVIPWMETERGEIGIYY